MRVELTEPQAHACDVRLRDGEQLFVGRAQSCEVVIPCKSVSKRHARFVRQDDQVVIEDLGSRNGIRVNGVQVESAYLEPGDLIQVGRATLRLKGRGLVASGEETGFELVDGAEDALKPRLVLVDDLSSSWDLSESSTIGCRSENSIQLEGLGVSRFHAEVVKQGDSWVIKDLGATNGVTVNGEKVDSAILESGDEILIGQTRMRFELVAPRTPRKQGLRVVLAAAVALFCCATGVAASVGGGEGVELAVAENEDFLAGTQALIAGRYAQAQDRFASAELTLALGDKGDSRALRQLARELERIQTEPASALWARGEELLARCLRLNLAPEVEAWLQSQRAFLRDNRGAQERLDQALTQTESAQREANLDQALAAFMDAAVVCEGIGAEALCSERAQAAAERARSLAIARIGSDLRGLEAQTPPAWSGIQEVAERGLEFAREVQLKLELRQTIARSQREREAARRLVRAAEHLDAGRVDAGLSELEGINDASYYAPAKAALAQRVELSRLLRRATELYARGSGQQARDVLDEAFDLDRLPLQEVQKQVGALRQAWIVVEREFTRATRADKAGDHVAARAGFAEVLRLEPSPRNRYHELALERLAYAEAAIRDEIQSDLRGLEHLLEAPLEGLRQAELAEAGRLARAVREHPGVTGSQTARVEAAIKVFATRLDAEERVKDALFANDLDACGRLEGQLAFLDAWLPVGAPERKGLSDAQERLGKRLARLASTRRLSEASK